MRYFRTDWRHNFAQDPIRIFDAVSDDGRVVARCEAYADGSERWGEVDPEIAKDSFIEGDFFDVLKNFKENTVDDIQVTETDQETFEETFNSSKAIGKKIESLGPAWD